VVPTVSSDNLPVVVSVVMSVYNGGNYLHEAIDSILEQSFADFEFVIVDDASTDRSLEILKDCAARDSRVHVVLNERNLGLTRSLNKGITLARGELIARMDADDVSLPQRLEKQVAYLSSHEDCVVVGCRILSIDPDGDPIRRELQAESHDGIEWALFRGFGGGIPHPTAMFRRAAALAVGGYREDLRVTQDLDLWLRLAECGRLANIPEILLHYRRHLDAISVKKYSLQRQTAETVLRDTFRRRDMDMPPDFMTHFPEAKSPHEVRLEWSRLAAWDGFCRTAQKPAIGACLECPRSPASWKALVRALVYSYWYPVRKRVARRRELLSSGE